MSAGIAYPAGRYLAASTPDPEAEMTSSQRAGSMAVTVAVLTYRRNRELATLLPALTTELASAPPGSSVLVVDNSPDAGAREVVEAAGPGLRYACESIPGIAAARNRALDLSATDLLVFIDDDEMPVAGWLGQLLATFHDEPVAAVVGPVVSHFTKPLEAFVEAGGFFRRRRLPTGTAVTVAATNNLLLDLSVVRRLGLRFDDRFGLTGGSDYLFTSSLHRAGGRMVWCDEAVVLDLVPAHRCTPGWVLRRAFRTGNGTAVIEVTLAGPGAAGWGMRLTQLRVGLLRVAVGTAECAGGLLTRSVRLRATGARHVARGAGLSVGAVGRLYAEYRRPLDGPPSQGAAPLGVVA